MHKHRLTIHVADRTGKEQLVLKSGVMHVPKRLLRLLFGDFCEVLVLNPGRTVEHIDIHEIRSDGDGKQITPE